MFPTNPKLHAEAQKPIDSFAWTDFLDVQEESLATRSQRSPVDMMDTMVSKRRECNPPSPTSSLVFCEEIDGSTPTIPIVDSRDTPRRSVSFSDTVELRMYNVTLGDHPLCRGGMALQCDWDHAGSEMIDLEAFELHSNKRRKEELRLNYGERRQRLVDTTGLSTARLLQIEYKLFCNETTTYPSNCAVSSRYMHRTSSNFHLLRQGDV